MLTLNRSTLTGLGVATAAVALAALTPALASGGDDAAEDARGAAVAASKVVHKFNGTVLDDFDSCARTPAMTMVVNAPRAGYLEVTGQVSAARDASFAGNGLLRADVTVRGNLATMTGQAALTQTGSGDGHIAVTGVIKVPKGASIVRLRLSECDAGAAFVVQRALTATYHEKGNVSGPAPSPLRQAVSNH